MTTKSWLLLDGAYRLGKGGEFLRLDLFDSGTETTRHAKMPRMIERDPGAGRPVAPIFDIMREAALAGVEIDGGNALTRLQKRDSNMHRRSRLS